MFSGLIFPLDVSTKLGNLPLVFIKVLISPANLIYSLFSRLPLFRLSVGLGALTIDFTVIALLLFLFKLVTLEVKRYKYCSDVTCLLSTVTVLGTVFLDST